MLLLQGFGYPNTASSRYRTDRSLQGLPEPYRHSRRQQSGSSNALPTMDSHKLSAPHSKGELPGHVDKGRAVGWNPEVRYREHSEFDAVAEATISFILELQFKLLLSG